MPFQKFEQLLNAEVNSNLKTRQAYLQNSLDSVRRYIERSAEFTPLTTNLFLKHIDISLDAAKNFIVIASTAFLGSLTVTVDRVGNIDVSFVRLISLLVLLGTSAVFGLLWISRTRAVDAVLDHYKKLDDTQRNLYKDELEIQNLTSQKNIEKLKKELVAGLKEHPKLKETIDWQ